MEISSYTATASQSFSRTTMQMSAQTEQDAQPQQVGRGGSVDTYNAPRHGHHHGNHHGHHQQRAMGVFKQELNAMFSASFGAQFMTMTNPYSATGEEQSSAEVAASTLNSAQKVVSQSPEVGSKSLLLIRQKVESAATLARQTVGTDSDLADVEQSVSKLNTGLDQLDTKAASVVTSSSSVLHVNTMRSDQSAISINTQEGDLVRLKLSEITHSSVSDFAVSNENGSSSFTSIRLSEHSNFMLKIDGDINDEELEAIQNVFAQAESIANEFFDGDISAALQMSANIDYDKEQLSQVNLNFRSVEKSSSYYSQYTQTQITPVAGPIDNTEPTTDQGVVKNEAAQIAVPVEKLPIVASEVEEKEPVETLQPAPQTTAVNAEEVAQETQSAGKEKAVNSFFDMLSGFMQRTSVSFQSTSSGSENSFSFYHSQSFKLDILKAVIELKAPEEVLLASEQARELIDGIKGVETAEV